MDLAEQMKARIAEQGAKALADERDEFERIQCQGEEKMAKAAAARSQKPNGALKIPPLPERPAELRELEARLSGLSHDRHAIEAELRGHEENHQRLTDDDILDEAAERIARGEAELTDPGAVLEAIDVSRKRLDLAGRAEGKVRVLVFEGRERHNRAIAKALRPLHRAAVRRIHSAVLELEAANAAELAVRNAVPGAPLERFTFPGVGTRGPHGVGHLQFWIAFVRRHGMLDDPEPQADSTAAAL